MIENDKQLEITQQWLRRFRDGLRTREPHPDPIGDAAMRSAIESQIEEFASEIQVYLLQRHVKQKEA